ncbi:FSH1-domain-containing protein [Pholiota conissans]|uniref:FSH1-domain-containing protein n=1 Tax=Pholiota conissans TaxID=109636 RepID=A0A9P5Z269_9AGAR|nr:FSH1-domain-containing protein [Pholiota conissans]
MTTKPMTRVLVLHGYAQNNVIFSKRLAALRKEGKDIDFVFVAAPHTLLPEDMFAPPSSFDAQGDDAAPTAEQIQSSPSTAQRGWWRAKQAEYEGLTDSLIYLRNIMKETTFDGVLGFSQGAALAALLTSLLERPHLYPPFLIDGKSPHPPFKFCIAVSGFRMRDSFCDPFFSPPYETPTLHVIGKTDALVSEESSRRLVEASKNPRVEEHEGGHFVPSKAPWRKFLANYIRDPAGDVPSPPAAPAEAGSVTASAEASGANTPNPA